MKPSWKLLFVGEPGAGKTTCIAAVSDIEPVTTDVECTDELAELKPSTTVALDYGELDLGDHGRLLLYGLPGQARFRYMFDVVRDGLLGVALLVDASARDPLHGLRETLESYAEGIRERPCVLCVNKGGDAPVELMKACQSVAGSYGLVAPVIAVDARQRSDVVRVFELLFLLLEQDAGPGARMEVNTWL